MAAESTVRIPRATNRHRTASLVVVALALAAPGAFAQPGLAHLPWMLGCWESADAEPGSGETWRVTNDGTMIGFGRVVSNAEVVATEQMRIERGDDGNLAFIASPSGQATARFVLVSIADDEVVFENREHDFPQRIIYRLLSLDRMLGRIEGVVDGTAKSADFPFRRIDCEDERRP